MKDIYADYNGTSPASEQHFDQLMTIFKGKLLGNASSTHRCGRQMRLLRENARDALCASLGHVEPEQMIFTSGATEANNMLIKGLKKEGDLIYTAGEHASVAKPIKDRQQQSSVRLQCIPLTAEGIVDPVALLQAVDEKTAFVTIMLVNNETGCLNPVEDLAEKIRKKNSTAHIHIDAVQGWGKVPLDFIRQSPVDSLALSGHKVGGISGAGALYLKNPNAIAPLLLGGAHEHGMRAGTESMIAITSMGLRAEAILKNPTWLHHTHGIRNKLAAQLQELGYTIWDGPSQIGNTIRVSHPEVPLDELMLHLELNRISVSSGSACSSGQPHPSSTLLSMGASDWEARNSVRISFGEGSLDEHGERIFEAFQSFKRS